MFPKNFANDNTPTTLLKELGSLKMEGKEKVKDFNQRFTHILNKLPVDTKPHDSITTNYYMSRLPTSIKQYVKWARRPTLLENCEESIVVEKCLHAFGVIKDAKSTIDSKDVRMKPQTMASKGRDKEATYIETLTRLVKSMTTEVSELKQHKIDTFASSHLSR